MVLSPKLVYGTNTITNAVLVSINKDALVYNIMIDDDTKLISASVPALKGAVKKNILDYNLLLKDILDKDRYTYLG
jgi:hypothetical protein